MPHHSHPIELKSTGSRQLTISPLVKAGVPQSGPKLEPQITGLLARVLATRHMAALDDCWTSGIPVSLDLELPHASEAQKQAVLSVAPAPAAGSEKRWLGHLISLEARSTAQSMIESVVQHSNDAIIAKDLNNTVTSWNRAAEKLFGWSGSEMIGDSIEKIIPDDLLDELDDSVRGVRKGSEVNYGKTIRRCKDGTEVFVQLTVSPVRNEYDEIVGSSTIARNLSRETAGEEQLRHMAAIIESSDDAMTSLMIDGTIMSWNPAAERIYGFSAQEAVGQNIRIIVPDETAGELSERLKQAARGEKTDQFETTRRRKDGNVFPAMITYSPLRGVDDEVMGLIAISRDISETVEIQEKVVRLPGLDDLTGTANKPLFMDRLEKALASAARLELMCTVHLLDIAGFDEILRRHGRAFADKVLEMIAVRLRRTIRNSDTIGRVDPATFAIIQTNVNSREGSERMIEKLFEAVEAPLQIDGSEIRVSFEIGAAVFPEHAADSDDLFSNARAALVTVRDREDLRARIYNGSNFSAQPDEFSQRKAV